MERLVNDLLTLSAPESEQTRSPETPFTMRRCCAPWQPRRRRGRAGRHAIALDMARPDGHLQPGRPASAFGNLVSNAIRYTPAGGTITVAWRPKTTARVFGHRQRHRHPRRAPAAAHRTLLSRRPRRSRETGGTGLGPAIVKHVLQRTRRSSTSRASPARAVRSPSGCRNGASNGIRPTWATTRDHPAEPPAAARRAATTSN